MQEYGIVRRLLHLMLKRNPEERANLSDILQDSDFISALQNPLDGDPFNHTVLYLFISLSLYGVYRSLVRCVTREGGGGGGRKTNCLEALYFCRFAKFDASVVYVTFF